VTLDLLERPVRERPEAKLKRPVSIEYELVTPRHLIYQVAIGPQSALYEQCIKSVAKYCERIGAAHYVQREPILKIKPDPRTTNRSEEAVSRLGYLPIFEKENAFTYLHAHHKVIILDADIYIREKCTKDIFREWDTPFAGVYEDAMPSLPWHRRKLQGYTRMQYGSPDRRFFNMGLMCLSDSLLPYISGMTPKQFIQQERFRDFVDGKGVYKWSTDQTLLNHWIEWDEIPVTPLDWKWNCLYTTVNDEDLKKAHFIHFFLKDKLPQRGENVEQLMEIIDERLL